jgi:predicted transcriptional regulator
MTLQELLEKLSKSSALNTYVKDEGGQLIGIITHSAMRRYLNHHEEIPDYVTVKEMMNQKFEVIHDETPIHEVLRKMIEMDLEALPVVDENQILQGEVERTAIVHQYQELLIHAESAKAMAKSMKFIHRQYHEKSEVIPGFFLARINVPSAFINQSLRSLNVRQTYGVDILLIRRTAGNKELDIIPDVNDKLQASDQLLIFGDQAKVELLCNIN